ncbi:hypothetical protein GCM10009416_50490 [Craurococcus roseus]|uniref:NERD domain-containing protein n=1 Tax=Craurococcus roseus TaxID=77585 RepID=A0ABN1GAR4_9PROT
MSGRLAQALERINRKERNLLIRAALGHKEVPLRLSSAFRKQVAKKLNLMSEVPEDAWWATDYHISWLAGALTVYVEGDGALTTAKPNPWFGERRLVEGNQEDVDLVVAFGKELLLIEAKAYGAFSNAQLASKLVRLNLLHDYYKGLGLATECPVNFRILLISPMPPQKLTTIWPNWVRAEAGVPWIPLELNTSASVLEVRRCNQDGQISAAGDHWRVVPHGSNSKFLAHQL